MFRRAINLLLCSGFWMQTQAAPPMRDAPEMSAKPANQLVLAGNACGPTALLNAFRFGNKDWQRSLENIKGSTDKERLQTLIRESGMRPSNHIKGRPRWSRKGVNIADLCDMANETTRGQLLPLIQQDALFMKKGESQEKLIRRVHRQLHESLAKGLPPVISLRRFVRRGSDWVVLDAHFVTLISIPRKYEKGSRSFAVSYIDPWGGKISTGHIAIPEHPVLSDDAEGSPCLEAVFPQAAVGRKLVRKGERSTLSVSAMLGRW